MFVKQRPIRKFTSYFTPSRIRTIVVVLVIILFCLGTFIYYLYAKKSAFSDKQSLFETLIYEYALNRTISDPSRVQFYMNSFTFDSVMLTAEQLNLSDDRKIWYADSETFGSFVNTLNALMAATIDPTSRFYKSESIWKMLRHAIREIEAKLPSVPENYKFPWGVNWYQFSVSYPLFLVSTTYMHRRLFRRDDEFMTRHLSSYIANYFKDPPTSKGIISMGWLRNGPNAILMAVPYIGGHLFLNDWNEHSTGMEYIRSYVTLKFVTTKDGFYPDGSFVFHTELRAFGYITSAYQDFVLVSKFLGITNSLKAVHLALAKSEHPTIPRHFGPWFNRTARQYSSFSRLGKLGFFVYDHMRGISAKTADWIISFNGQQPDICFYESDASNYSWAQYWTMARRFMYKDTPENIYKQLLPYYPGIWSYGRQAIDIKSQTTTTETYLPAEASCIICKMGDEAIGMYNKYIVDMAGNYFDVTELTLVTRIGVHCYYNIKPNISLAASNTLTLGVQVDELSPEGRLAGEGAEFGKRFAKTCSFVYPGVLGKTLTDEIDDPMDANKKLTVLYIEPRLDSGGSECGFSNVHSESGHNELIVPPQIDRIETAQFTLIFSDVKSVLILQNKITKTAVVSTDMGPIYRTDLSIEKSVLDDTFNRGYKPADKSMVLIGNNYKLSVTNGAKYQATIINANLKFSVDASEYEL